MKKFYVIISVLVVLLLVSILFVEYKKINHITQVENIIKESENTARRKGNEAMVKSLMSNMRVEAEFIYDGEGSYLSLCRGDLLNDNNLTLKSSIDRVLKIGDFKDQKEAGFSCISSTTKYAISFVSKDPEVFEDMQYCVDSSVSMNGGSINTSTVSCSK